jgi:signal transduction histidine kinase/CheY-like chemotaxis protein
MTAPKEIQDPNISICWIDASGRIIESNEETCLLFGIQREDLLCCYLEDILSPQSGLNWKRQWQQLETTDIIIKEITIFNNFTESRTVTAEITLEKNPDSPCFNKGKLTIIPKKEPPSSKPHLSSNVYWAKLSHEMRTPLNGILGINALLKETNLDTKQTEMLTMMERAGEHLLCLINDLLDYSKIEAGELILSKEVFPFENLTEGLMSVVHSVGGSKNVQVNFLFQNAIPETLTSDLLRIRQCLINLLNNALKFTHKGMIDILFAWQDNGEKENTGLVVSIRDTGIGMSSAQLEQIFEPYTQADAAIAREFGGTGLGLSITKDLLKLLGGWIQAKSQIGIGSEFIVFIPLEASLNRKHVQDKLNILNIKTHASTLKTLPLESPTVPKPEEKTWGHAFKQGLKILLAEDNLINQKVTLGLLKKMGLDADAVINGQEAVTAIQSKPYDLVLMDCQMPLMDGFKATQLIREMNMEKSNIPIVAITANALPGDKEKCLEMGMSDYVSKPISLSGLEQVLKNHLESDPLKIENLIQKLQETKPAKS